MTWALINQLLYYYWFCFTGYYGESFQQFFLKKNNKNKQTLLYGNIVNCFIRPETNNKTNGKQKSGK